MSIIITIKTISTMAAAAPPDAIMTWEPPQIELPTQISITDLGPLKALFLESINFTIERKNLNIPADWEITSTSPVRQYNTREDEEILRNLPTPENPARKLILGILQFLLYYWSMDIKTQTTFLYVGFTGDQWNALKTIIRFFASNPQNFSNWHWHVLLQKRHAREINDFSGYNVQAVNNINNKNIDALFAKAKGQVIFISNYTYFDARVNAQQNLIQTMSLQQGWIQKHNPHLAMLRFHLPYSGNYSRQFKFFSGLLLKNFYGKYNAVDSRIVIKQGADLSEYDGRKIEQQMFYYNYDERFLHEYNYGNFPLPDNFATYKFDSVSEVIIMYEFMKKFSIQPSLENFVALQNYFFPSK